MFTEDQLHSKALGLGFEKSTSPSCPAERWGKGPRTASLVYVHKWILPLAEQLQASLCKNRASRPREDNVA